MLSLDNVFSDEEFLAWAAKVERDAGRSVHYLCELKIDGLALSLRYERGRLVSAATRGDGRVGEDVTENVLRVGGIPHRLAGKGHPALVEVRGEVFFNVADFESLNAYQEQMGDRLFANPRNAASGSLRQKTEGKNETAARRRPSAAVATAHDGARHRSVARSTGRDAERDLRAAGLVGTPHEPVLPGRRLRGGGRCVHPALREPPPRRRARDRRDRGQGRRARPARRARSDQPCAALGDRVQVPARAGQHQAARHRRLGRPHRSRDSVRRHGAGAGRRAASFARRPSTIRTSSS